MASSRDVQLALQRARTKISSLQQQLGQSPQSPETCPSPWKPSKELRESLVDMYTANPGVNVELRQRLPSPDRTSVSPVSPLRTSVSPVSPLRRSASPVSPLRRSASPVSPLRRSASPVSLLISRPPGGSGEMDTDFSPSRGSSPRAESRGDLGPGSPSRKHLVPMEDSSHHAALSGQTFDRDKNISFLLKELDALRDLNKKLQDQLVQKEKELQRREVEEELREAQTEAQAWERPAAVLEEVLSAQKDRDRALMSRLLLANEERDEALLRARRLQQEESDCLQLDDTDQDVERLLQAVCCASSGQEVQRFGSVLVQRLRLARQRRDDITAQEMKALMEERDGSVGKFKRLEQEVMQQRKNEDQLLRERGGALEDRRRLEAELQVLRANHSEAPPPLEAPPLLVQVQQLSVEKQSVEAELQRSQEAERQASERVCRLERLVEVLRKKVGAGNLRSVV